VVHCFVEGIFEILWVHGKRFQGKSVHGSLETPGTLGPNGPHWSGVGAKRQYTHLFVIAKGASEDAFDRGAGRFGKIARHVYCDIFHTGFISKFYLAQKSCEFKAIVCGRCGSTSTLV
jgi:hypothetical protein